MACHLQVFAAAFWLITLSGTVAADEPDLVTVLVGEWRGRAVQTPVGPAPYDIRFQWTGKDKDCISGTADNGFSNHTWTFCRTSAGLTLDFLSDFSGNQEPIHLRVVSREEGKLVFHAGSHPFMDVLVFPRGRKITVDIMHHDRLHVRIEWSRPPDG
ncbi:MAG: hypothetical protein WD750_09270 [Gammaproteobacteria bacterium]